MCNNEETIKGSFSYKKKKQKNKTKKQKSKKQKNNFAKANFVHIYKSFKRKNKNWELKTSIIIIGTYVCNDYMYDVCIGTTHTHTHIETHTHIYNSIFGANLVNTWRNCTTLTHTSFFWHIQTHLHTYTHTHICISLEL